MAWITDRYGNPVNSDQITSLVIEPDGTNFVVQAGNTSNAVITQFWTGTAMTQAEAEALRDKIADLLGVFDPTS